MLTYWGFSQIAPIGSAGIQMGPNSRGIVLESKIMKYSFISSHPEAEEQFSQMKFEYRQPFQNNKVSHGTRFLGFKGWSIYPQITGGLQFANFKDINNNVASKDWGLSLSPSINIALPFAILEIGLQSNYFFKKTTPFGAFKLEPTIGLRLDGLFEVLDYRIELASEFGKWVTSETGRDIKTSDHGSYTTTTITTYYKTEYKTIRDYYGAVNSFHGPTLKYSYSNKDFSGNSKLFALGYSARISQISLDGFIEHGIQGYASSMTKPVFIQTPKVKDNEIDKNSTTYIAQGKQTRIYGRVGMDILRATIRLLNGDPSGGDGKPTPSFRILAGLGIGYSIVQKPYFVNPQAELLKDEELTSQPDLWRKPVNDIRKTESGMMYHAFVSIEYGVVGIDWSYSMLSNSVLSRGAANVGIFYIIPFQAIKDKKTFKE